MRCARAGQSAGPLRSLTLASDIAAPCLQAVFGENADKGGDIPTALETWIFSPAPARLPIQGGQAWREGLPAIVAADPVGYGRLVAADKGGRDVINASFFGGKVLILHLRSIEDDRGVLTPIEFGPLCFYPLRAFFVQAPAGTSRGGHGHKTGRQILVRISGEIEVQLSWQSEDRSVVLGRENQAIMIASPVWSRQLYNGNDPRLLVLCDTPYDPNSYIYEKR